VNNLKWISDGQKKMLMSEGHILVSLHIRSAINAEFLLNDKTYSIRTKGIWNPSYGVFSADQEIITLSYSFWTTKGRIVFNDGAVYESAYTSKGGLKLRFLNNGHEILSYGYVFENKRPSMVFSLGTDMIDAEKLLLLAALGMTMFSGVFMEIAGGTESTAWSLITTMG
jgi:hypothetical protein